MVNILGQDVTEDKLQEAAKLQALEDRAYLITSLSSLFFSTYYIDLGAGLLPRRDPAAAGRRRAGG